MKSATQQPEGEDTTTMVRYRKSYPYDVKFTEYPSLMERILFCFGFKPRIVWGFRPVEKLEKLGSSGDRTFYELPRAGTLEKEWKILKSYIDDIIRCTPTKSEAEAIPLVVLRPFITKRRGKGLVATVTINSSSTAYATRLRRIVQRSKPLERSGFQVIVMTKDNPIQRDTDEDAKTHREPSPPEDRTESLATQEQTIANPPLSTTF